MEAGLQPIAVGPTFTFAGCMGSSTSDSVVLGLQVLAAVTPTLATWWVLVVAEPIWVGLRDEQELSRDNLGRASSPAGAWTPYERRPEELT